MPSPIAYTLQKQPLEVLYWKFVLRNFAKSIGKHLYQSLFFDKVAGLRTATLLKKRPWRSCFAVHFSKFLRTPFLQNISGGLLLTLSYQNQNYWTRIVGLQASVDRRRDRKAMKISKLMNDKNEKPRPGVLKWKTSVMLIVCLKEIIP